MRFLCGTGGLIVSRCQNEKREKGGGREGKGGRGGRGGGREEYTANEANNYYTISTRSILIYCYHAI